MEPLVFIVLVRSRSVPKLSPGSIPNPHRAVVL